MTDPGDPHMTQLAPPPDEASTNGHAPTPVPIRLDSTADAVPVMATDASRADAPMNPRALKARAIIDEDEE